MKRIVFTVLIASVSLMSCGGEQTLENESISNLKEQVRSDNSLETQDLLRENSVLLIEEVIEEFKTCKAATKTKHSCKDFVAKAICKYYNIDDFKNQGNYDSLDLNEFIDYDDIFDRIDSNKYWSKLGMANNQDVLDKAQENANKGIATLAIDVAKNNKTVVLIVKGKQIKSGKWGVSCPASAALNASKPTKSFVGKTLNYSFSSPENITLYTRHNSLIRE
tara:strand:+ start:66 stop:728 length:663 start_codon:yes stop_codon:yes gene_type:complete